MFFNVVKDIAIRNPRYDHEWLVIQYVGSEEL